MARLVRFEATAPIELKPHEKSAWICACGLSQNLPHCDGSHKKCKTDGGEESGKLYVYNADRTAIARVDDE